MALCVEAITHASHLSHCYIQTKEGREKDTQVTEVYVRNVLCFSGNFIANKKHLF